MANKAYCELHFKVFINIYIANHKCVNEKKGEKAA